MLGDALGGIVRISLLQSLSVISVITRDVSNGVMIVTNTHFPGRHNIRDHHEAANTLNTVTLQAMQNFT